jgi:hypothetical protein
MCVKKFSNAKKITHRQGFNHLNSPKVPHNGVNGQPKTQNPNENRAVQK